MALFTKTVLKSTPLTTKHWSLSHTRWSVQVKTEVSNEKAGGLTPIRHVCETQREWERRPVWWWMGGEAMRWGCCCNHQLERVAREGDVRSEGPTKSRRTHFTLLHWSCLTHRLMGCFQLLSPELSHTHTHNKKSCHLIAMNFKMKQKNKLIKI